MEVVNTEVNPPIKVLSKVTRSLNHWSTNRFIDPSDNVPFVVEDLTPKELGHIYYWKVVVDQWINIHMPYKVMDSDTGKLVRGLRSFKSIGSYVNGKLPERHLKNPKSCIKDFRLNRDDFEKFSRRVSSLNGNLVKDEVDTEDLKQRIFNLSASADSVISSIESARDTLCRVSSDKYYMEESDLSAALNVFRSFRSDIDTINRTAVQIVLDIDKLSKEVDKHTEKVVVQTEFNELQEKLKAIRAIPVERYEREAIHKCNVDMGKATDSEIPVHIRSLTHEINELKAYYPCLSRLRVVSNNEVAIDLSGVDITLMENEVIVRGDPGALSAYAGENSTPSEGLSSRRVRAIVRSDK